MSKPDALAELAAAVPNEKKEEKAPKAKPTAPLTREEAFKTLKAVEAKLNKQFETTNSLVRLGSKVGQTWPNFSTGLPSLDRKVLRIGGVPRGRIIEIFGPEMSGKTTLTLEMIACEQKSGALAAFVDAEHALDPNYAARLGVDVNNLIVSQPDSGEQALETTIALIESRAVSVIAIDSVAALVPQAELDGEMGDSHMGLQARLMSQAMRKIRGIAATNGVTVIFINQIREKVGLVFGSPEVTPGGRALRFYSSIRLDVRKLSKTAGGEIKSGDTLIGHRMKVKGVKNKFGSPFGETELDLIYGLGLDRVSDTVEYAVELGIIVKAEKGSFYDVPFATAKGHELRKVQGLDGVKEALREDPASLSVVLHEIELAHEAIRKAELEEAK